MIKAKSAAEMKNVGIFQLNIALQLCIFCSGISNEKSLLLARAFTFIHSAIMKKCFGKKRGGWEEG